MYNILGKIIDDKVWDELLQLSDKYIQNDNFDFISKTKIPKEELLALKSKIDKIRNTHCKIEDSCIGCNNPFYCDTLKSKTKVDSVDSVEDFFSKKISIEDYVKTLKTKISNFELIVKNGNLDCNKCTIEEWNSRMLDYLRK